VRAFTSSHTVNFRASRTLQWPARIQTGLLDLGPNDDPGLFGDLDVSRRRFVVIDETVFAKYGRAILDQLRRYGVEHDDPLIIAGGEHAKCHDVIRRIHLAMEASDIGRLNQPMLIWGGGSLHDVAGFAASTYRRGVPYIMIGTTLLCSIDAMYALKVSINELWKNRIGGYYPPVAAYADPLFFASLEDTHIREGIGEILKVGICLDRELFLLLESDGARAVREKFQGGDPATMAILHRALAAMGPELSDNPYEDNPQRASYGGHDISPGMEPDLTHGVAVALNLQWSTLLSWRRGHIDDERRDRILKLTADLGLPRWHPVLEDVDRLHKALTDTARHRGGRHLVPAPADSLGEVVYLNDITRDELTRGLDDMHHFAS
jgi:3-dehydroquinate synthetase